MRKSFRKAIALLLVAATMTGFMALGVNASSTYGTKHQTVGVTGSTNASYVECYFRYFYDTDNVDILTRVAAYSQYIGMNSTSVTPGNENVYLYNMATVKYPEGDPVSLVYRSNPFYPKGIVQKSESKMIDNDSSNWFNLNDAYRTIYARSQHGLCTYVSTQHSSPDPNDELVFPETGETLIYHTTQSWK